MNEIESCECVSENIWNSLVSNIFMGILMMSKNYEIGSDELNTVVIKGNLVHNRKCRKTTFIY